MANETITQVRDRLRLLVDIYLDHEGTDISDGETDLILPAYTVVATAPATWTPNGARHWLCTRPYELWVYWQEITDTNNEEVIRSALAACDAPLVGLAMTFNLNNQLTYNSLPLVIDSGNISDSSPAQSPLRGKVYAAFRLQIPVITAHSA